MTTVTKAKTAELRCWNCERITTHATGYGDGYDYCLICEASRDHRGPIAGLTRCADCGEFNERTGHMGCQYPR